ncbi:MAG: glycosyltransferase family 2 protein, partial [Pirellulaceae bacterium]
MNDFFNNSLISIIIPVYRCGQAFNNCLASLSTSLLAPTEVIVVVDGNDPQSYETAVSFGAEVLQLESNQGPAVARNQGAAMAKGDILFFMDADVTIHPDTLAKIAQVFHQDSTLAALIGSY